MILYVTRHGETDFNVEKRYTGSTDIPLNAKGLRQAEELANRLSDIKFDVIVSSHLLRARQTAEIIRKSVESPMVIMEEFAEVNIGVYEGLTREEAQAQYPEIWARQAEIYATTGARPIDDAPTGGETLRQFDARITGGLAKLKAMYAESKVLLVCHGFVARVINRQLMGLSFSDMDTFTLGNCEVVEYVHVLGTGS